MASYAYTFTSGDTVTPTKLNNARTVSDIVNADISASAAIAKSKLALTGAIANTDIDAAAAIAHSKLANITAGQILLGNSSNVPTATAISGDVTLSSSGVITLARPATLDTAKNSTSGTSIEFTGIPSWAKQITVMLNGVSTSGTSRLLVQIGTSGGFENTGYNSAAGFSATAGTFGSATDGFLIEPTSNVSASTLRYGSMIISLLGSNTWVEQLGLYSSTTGCQINGGGAKALAGVLDRIRVTTINGTDTFDAGSINIMYVG